MKNSIFNAVCKTRYLALLVVLILTCGNAWGTDLSVTISDYATANSWTGSGGGPYTSVTLDANVTATVSGGSNTGKYYSDWRLYQGESATITITTTSGTLSSITYTYSTSNGGVLNTSGNGTSIAAGYRKASGTSISVSGTSYTLYVGNTGTKTNGQVRITKIEVSYTPAASCTTSPTVTAASNSSVTATTATVSCSSGISSLGSAGCSISSYGFVIGGSANPSIGGSGVTQHEVSTSYTVTGTSFYKDLTGLTAETTYYVRPYATNGKGTAYGTQTSFTTPALPKYTVTLMDDGDTRTQASYEASVTLPSRAGCAGYTFAGWTKTWVAPQSSWTTTAPTIIPAGSYTPSANENLYPVYTKTEGGGGSTTESYGWETSDDASNWTISGIEKYDTYKKTGSYSGKIARVSTGESTIAFNDKVKVTSFSFQFLKQTTNNNYNVRIETSSDGSSWDDVENYNMSDFSSKETWYAKSHSFDGKTALYVRFVCYTSTAVRWVDDISITYTGGSTTYYISVPGCCTDPGLAYGTGSVTKTYGASAFTNTLTNSHSVSVTYGTSPTGIATVAADGTVTIVGAGTTTITASFAGNATYCADEASYTLTVNKANISPTLDYSSTTLSAGATSSSPTVGGNPGSGSVSYAVTASSPSGCVTVDPSTGVVTANAVGTATVTATIGASTNYNGGTATANFTITAASYQFWYGPSNSGDGWTSASFSDVGNNEWQISNFVMPAFEWDGAKQLMWNVSGSGISATNREFYAMSFAHTQSVCGNYDYYNDGDNKNGWIRGPAAGAKGTLRIYDNKADNGWCAFIPNEYVLKFGSSEVRFFENGSDATVWETAVTDLTTLNGGSWTGSTTYRVGVGDASHNWVEVYNKCAATAASSMGYKTNSGNNWATGLNNISTARGKFRIWINNCTNGNWECHFVPYHRVVFHANWPAGVGTDQYSDDVSVEETNSSIPLASAPSAPTGYHFLGWFDAASGGNQITTARTISAGATADIDLYAHWSNQTEITLDRNGKGTADGSATATYGSNLGATFTGITYTGTRYQLLGYCVNGTTDPIIIDAEGNLQPNVTGYTDASSHWSYTGDALTLKAKWSGAGRTITWSANGGTYATTFVLDAGTIALPAGTPTSCDAGVTDTYTTFIGWYTTAAGTSDSPTASIGSCGTKIAGGESCPGADATYFAVWGDGSLEVVETKEVTLDFTDNSTWKLPDGSSNKVYSTTPNTYTNTYTISMVGDGNSSNGYYFNSTNSYFMMGKSGCYMELPSFGFVVSKIVGTTTSTCSGSVGWNIYAGSNEASSGVTGGSTSGKTFAISSDYDDLGTQYRVQVTSNHNLQLTSLDIYSATAGATGFISSCCSSTAVISVTPTSSSLALDIDGNANTTVNFSKSGTSNTVWLMEPTIDPAVGASFSGWAGTYKTAVYDLTFNATATGTYTIKEEGQDKGTSCSKYGTATITVAANPILTPSSASVDISASCGAASSATDITVNSRYLSSTSITASIAKSIGSGTFKISSDNSTFDTSNKTITGGTSSKATSHIYVRYDAIADETGSAEGTLTLTCGAKVVEIPISATVTCNCNIRFTSAADLVRVTAANGIWVQANSELALSGSYLKTNPDNVNVSIRAYTDNAHFQLKTSGATGEGAAKTSSANALALATNEGSNTANGWTGNIGIVYKPAAHNTTESATLTVEVYRYGGSTVYSTTTYTLYGRSLPENFVIAVTNGSGDWFAVPADMVAPWGNTCTGIGTYAPYPITVDNTTTPTVASNVPTRAVYKAAARTGAVNTSPWTMSYQSVPLPMQDSKYFYLYGSTGSANTIQDANNAESEQQKWVLDVIDWSKKKYNMHLQGRDYLLSYYSGKVGQYTASGKKADIYLLPISGSTCAYYAAPVVSCVGVDATNYTIEFDRDRTSSYEISTNSGSTWSDLTVEEKNACTDANETPMKLEANLPWATYRGQTIQIRAKSAGGCQAVNSFTVPNPNIAVNAGTWTSMTGLTGLAFVNTANSITISGLASCGDQTVSVTSSNDKISASVNQSTGVVTLSMTAENATTGTHTATLTFTVNGGTMRTQSVSITMQTKAEQGWDGGNDAYFSNGMLCDEDGILVDPLVCLQYSLYYNGSLLNSLGTFNAYTNLYLMDMNTMSKVTAHAMTRSLPSAGVFRVNLSNLTSNKDLIVGHKYRLVWENHSEDGSIADAITNSTGIPYQDCYMDFIYTNDCSSPTLNPGCTTSTTAYITWGNTTASCTNYSLEWYQKSKTDVVNYSIKDNTNHLIAWANGGSCYEANNNYLDDWIISDNSSTYKSSTYGYQVSGSGAVRNYIYTPRLNQLYASTSTSTVYEVTVTLQNTGTANTYAASCFAVDNTTSSTTVITSGYSANYNGVSSSYYATKACPVSSTITDKFTVSGLTATSRIGFSVYSTPGNKLYVQNVAIKRLEEGAHSSATIAKSESDYTINSLTTGQTYYAVLKCGSTTSNEISFTPSSATPSFHFYSDSEYSDEITETEIISGTPMIIYFKGTDMNSCDEPTASVNNCFSINSSSLTYNTTTKVLTGYATISNVCAAADGNLTVSLGSDYELPLHCGERQIELVQWAPHGILVESYVLPVTTPQVGSIVGVANNGAYTIQHNDLDLTVHANELLKVTWGSHIENFRVPIMITSSCNSSTLSTVNENSIITVLAGQTLTINNALTCEGIEIYPTAKVQFSSGSLTADYIRLYNNGDTWANFAKFDASGASSITVDNVYADFRIDEDRYHFITLPFDIMTNDVTYAAPTANGANPPALRNSANNTAFYVRQYDGIARETGNLSTENTYNTNMPHIGTKGGNYAMTAGRGYMIAIGDQVSATGHKKRTLRFPMTMNSTNWAAEKADSKVVGGAWVADGTSNPSARPINKGWNLVGNPFMRELSVTSTSDKISTGHMEETGGVPNWVINDDGVRYITTYNAATDAFAYNSLASSFTLKPMAAFYIQMKNAKYINFQASLAGQAAASPIRLTELDEEEVNVILSLSVESQSDKAGVVLHNKYDAAYNETDNADYPKLMSNSQLALWSIAGAEQLASNGLPKTTTNDIPLGYQAPREGSYTFALDMDESDMVWLKHVWLTDLVQGTVCDLMTGTYQFSLSTAEKRSDRFLLGVELQSEKDVTTDIYSGGISTDMSRPVKFIYEDKLYIMRDGLIYDMTGKRANVINK